MGAIFRRRHGDDGMTVGLLSFASLIQGVSGKSLIGMTPEPGMLKNLMLSTDSLQTSGGYAFPADFTTDGYPKNGVTPAASVFSQITMPSNLLQSELMVLKFRQGTGQVTLGIGAPGATDVNVTAGSIVGGTSFNITLSGTAARVEFRFATAVPSSVSLSFDSAAFSGNFSGLVLCRASDEASVDNPTAPDDYFSDPWIAQYVELNPRTVRTMGMSNPNFGNVSQARYIPNYTTCFSVTNNAWPNGAWAGRTTQGTVGATSPYTCGSQPDATGAYVDGEMIQFQFDATTSGVPITLNFGGRGIKDAILGTGGSTGSTLEFVNANDLWTATYDKVTDAFWCQPDGQSFCVPYELLAGLANRINAHLWINLPVYIDNASVATITQTVRDKLAPSLECHFEYGNEPWNFGFPQAHYLTARGAALGFDSGNNRQLYGAQGLRLRKIMELVTAAWAPRSPSQLKRVMNCMAIAYGDVPSNKQFLLEGSDLNGSAHPNYAAAGFPNYDTAPNRPIDICEVLCYATYYQGAQTQDLDPHYTDAGLTAITTGGPTGWATGLIGAADAYAAGGATNIANAFAFLDWDIRQGTASGVTDPETMTFFNSSASLGVGAGGVYSAWDTVVSSFDTVRAAFASPMPPVSVRLYEGAMQSWYPSTDACTALGISTAYGGPTGKIAVLLDAFKKDILFYNIVRDQVAQFMAFSHSSVPVWFVVGGPNEWAASTGDVYAEKYQSWNFNVFYNHN